jgi:hypothetical protein
MNERPRLARNARPPARSRPWSARTLARVPALLVLTLLTCMTALPAQAQIAVLNQGYIPYSDPPINYRSNDLSDPVALLQKQLEQGRVSLTWEAGHGYLNSVLTLLEVPVASQTLVFSKTSFQYPKISPEHPRALYYNDDVYVGSVHEGKAIEIVSFDPRQGAIFYLLDERKVDKPAFQRAELDCTQCHIAAATRGVPGVLLRSVTPTATGTLVPGTPTLITDQESPFAERWGGWYVDGSLPLASRGNQSAPQVPPGTLVGAPGAAQLSALSKTFDPGAYLAPGSDPVALLVLAHQTQMHNLITLTSYKTRQALYSLQQRAAEDAAGSGAPAAASASAAALESLPEATRRQIERPANQLLRYLLFGGETPLGGLDAKPLIAGSVFAREFAARGVRDAKGRSLRDFDLSTRIFKYPASYLIYSAAFDALPAQALDHVYHRLLQVLTGADNSPEFAGLSAADRQAILEILLATKPGLPAQWLAYAREHHLPVAQRAGVSRE